MSKRATKMTTAMFAAFLAAGCATTITVPNQALEPDKRVPLFTDSDPPPYSVPECLAADAQGTMVAVGFSDGTIRVIDCHTWTIQRILPGGTDVLDLAFSRDGSHLASIDTTVGVEAHEHSATVRLWDTRTWQCQLIDHSVFFLHNRLEPLEFAPSVQFDETGKLVFWTRQASADEMLLNVLSLRLREKAQASVAGARRRVEARPAIPFAYHGNLCLLAAGFLWSVDTAPRLALHRIRECAGSVLETGRMIAYEGRADFQEFGEGWLWSNSRIDGVCLPSARQVSAWKIVNTREDLDFECLALSPTGCLLLVPLGMLGRADGVAVIDTEKVKAIAFLHCHSVACTVLPDQETMSAPLASRTVFSSGDCQWRPVQKRCPRTEATLNPRNIRTMDSRKSRSELQATVCEAESPVERVQRPVGRRFRPKFASIG